MLYGRLPSSRMPAGKRAKSNASASAQCTVSWCGGKRATRSAARSRSSSIASSRPARAIRGAVSAPSPGPISTSTSPGCGAIASTMRARTRGSCRKCCPNLLRGRCELNRKLERLAQAAGIGAAAAGDVERRAMVHGGAHERQAERYVHPTTEGCVLQHRQALVVVHGEHRIGVFQPLGHEERIGGGGGAPPPARRAGGGGRRGRGR